MQRRYIAAGAGILVSSAVVLGLIWGAVSTLYFNLQGAPVPGGLIGQLMESVFMMLQWVLGVGVIFAVAIWLLRRGAEATPESVPGSSGDALPGEGLAEQTTAPKD